MPPCTLDKCDKDWKLRDPVRPCLEENCGNNWCCTERTDEEKSDHEISLKTTKCSAHTCDENNVVIDPNKMCCNTSECAADGKYSEFGCSSTCCRKKYDEQDYARTTCANNPDICENNSAFVTTFKPNTEPCCLKTAEDINPDCKLCTTLCCERVGLDEGNKIMQDNCKTQCTQSTSVEACRAECMKNPVGSYQDVESDTFDSDNKINSKANFAQCMWATNHIRPDEGISLSVSNCIDNFNVNPSSGSSTIWLIAIALFFIVGLVAVFLF